MKTKTKQTKLAAFVSLDKSELYILLEAIGRARQYSYSKEYDEKCEFLLKKFEGAMDELKQ